MTDLDDDGRSLIDLARAAYEPDEQQRELVLGRVLKRAAWGAAVGSTVVHGAKAAGAASSVVGAPAAGATLSTGSAGLALKALLWCALGGGIGTAGYVAARLVTDDLKPATEQVRHSTLAITPSAATTPERAANLRVVPEPQADSVVAEPARATRNEISRQPSSAANRNFGAPSPLGTQPAELNGGVASATATFPDAQPAPRGAARVSSSTVSLGEEARGLAAVQEALRAGRGAEALRLLDAQQQRFARGALQDEREAARVLALCAVGRVSEAQRKARDFLTRSPDSPFAARIRASCAASKP